MHYLITALDSRLTVGQPVLSLSKGGNDGVIKNNGNTPAAHQ